MSSSGRRFGASHEQHRVAGGGDGDVGDARLIGVGIKNMYFKDGVCRRYTMSGSRRAIEYTQQAYSLPIAHPRIRCAGGCFPIWSTLPRHVVKLPFGKTGLALYGGVLSGRIA